jgi:hypothetical protein
METMTNAAEMARSAGICGKLFRKTLRRNLAAYHTFGTWAVEVGSDKYHRMKAELNALVATHCAP